MFGKIFGLSVVLFAAVFALATLGGWVMNIAQLLSCDLTEVSVKEAMKIVGIVLVPVGAVMGWIGN